MKKFLLFIYVLVACYSCRSQSAELPEGILSDSLMKELIIDFAVVDAAYSVSLTNSSMPKFRKELFFEEVVKKHETSREQFIKSLDYYAQNTKQLQRIYEEALKELSVRQAKAVR
jgi:hypothetical protein